MSLLDCPPEVIIEIILNLNLDHILTISQTCQTLHNIVQTTMSIQYKIKLAYGGLVDVEPFVAEGSHPVEEEDTLPDEDTPKTLITKDRMNILQDYQSRWSTLKFSQIDDIYLEEGAPMYELYGNVFVQLWAFHAADPVTLDIHKAAGMRVLVLPSTLRGIEKVREWRHPNLNVRGLLELAIDPDQDLMALVEDIPRLTMGQKPLPLRTHIRSLSTNSPHPAASYPVLEFFPQPDDPTDGRILPQILGDLYALMYNVLDGVSPSRIVLWRWTSGQMLMSLTTISPCLSFTFLTEDTMIVPVIYQRRQSFIPELFLYQLPKHILEHDPPNSDRSIACINNPPPKVIYGLPQMDHNRIIGYNFICRSHPLPNPRPYIPSHHHHHHHGQQGVQPSTSRHLPLPPFQSDVSDRIVSFSFIIHVTQRPMNNEDDDQIGPVGPLSYVLLTHSSTLLANLAKVPPSESNESLNPPSLSALSAEMERRLHIPNLDDTPDYAMPNSDEFPLPSPGGTQHALLTQPSSTTRVPLIIPWEEWSCDKTRWLPERPRRNWYSHTWGHRFVQPTLNTSEEPWDSFNIRVLDFNPYAIRQETQARGEKMKGKGRVSPPSRDDASDSSSSSIGTGDETDEGMTPEEGFLSYYPGATPVVRTSPLPPPPPPHPIPVTELDLPYMPTPAPTVAQYTHSRLVTEPSTIPKDVFLEDVTSSLPYLEHTSQRVHMQFQGVMIDEEHILNLKPQGHELELEIYTI